jgi:hypothetical protein
MKSKVERFQVLTKELDNFWKDKKFEKEYDYSSKHLYQYVKDSLDKENIYTPIFLQMSVMYDSIQRICKSGGLSPSKELEKLKAEKQKTDEELKTAKEDLKTKDALIKLLSTPK